MSNYSASLTTPQELFSQMPAIGHNEAAAIASFIEKRRAIWAARVPCAVKVIALAILEHMSPDNLECWPSKDRLAYMCNMTRNTFDRHYAAAKELFNYHERRGKTTIFSPKILDVAKELATLWPTSQETAPAKLRYAPTPKMGEGQKAPPPKMTLPIFEQTPPNSGGPTPPQNRGTNRQGIDKEEVLVLTDLSPDPGQDDGRMTASKAARIAFDLYNETARRCGLPQCRILNDARKRALALRVREVGGIDGFKQALANLEKSSYCQGQNDRGWVATIDYVCQPKGFAKLYEGGWGNGAHATMAARQKPDHMPQSVWDKILRDEAAARGAS